MFFIQLVILFGVFYYLLDFFTVLEKTDFSNKENIDGDALFLSFIPNIIVFMLGGFLVFCCSIYMILKTAQIIKTMDLKRKPIGGEYLGEFFLLLFHYIGFWIIQPRINEYAELEENTDKTIREY